MEFLLFLLMISFWISIRLGVVYALKKNKKCILLFGISLILFALFFVMVGKVEDWHFSPGVDKRANSNLNDSISGMLNDSVFTIKISGTYFAGTLIASNILGQSRSYPIASTDPYEFFKTHSILLTLQERDKIEHSTHAEFPLTAHSISMTLQKRDVKGTLKVEILKDGKIVNSKETSSPYGVVSLATN